MLSLDLLDKVAKRLDFHSTAIIFLDFFDKDQTSLNITRLHSTHSTRWPNGSICSSIFCRVKSRVKNRVVLQGPYCMPHFSAFVDLVVRLSDLLVWETALGKQAYMLHKSWRNRRTRSPYEFNKIRTSSYFHGNRS